MLSFGLISTIRKCNHWKRKTRSTCVSFLLSDGNRESRARLIGKYANTVKHTNYLEACLNWRTLDACRTIVHKGSEQHHARSPRTMLAGLIRQLFLRCLIVTSVSPVCAAYPTRAIPSYPSLQNIFFFFFSRDRLKSSQIRRDYLCRGESTVLRRSIKRYRYFTLCRVDITEITTF